MNDTASRITATPINTTIRRPDDRFQISDKNSLIKESEINPIPALRGVLLFGEELNMQIAPYNAQAIV